MLTQMQHLLNRYKSKPDQNKDKYYNGMLDALNLLMTFFKKTVNGKLYTYHLPAVRAFTVKEMKQMFKTVSIHVL